MAEEEENQELVVTEENREDLEAAVRDMHRLEETIATEGFQLIIKPTIIEMGQAAIKAALSKGEDAKALYKAQAAVEMSSLLISDEYLGIVSDLENTINFGHRASEALSKAKPKNEEE